MTRPVPEDSDMVNVLGIAQRLNVSKSAVSNWRFRYEDFPAPLDISGVVGIPLWRWGDVRQWYVNRPLQNGQ